MAQSLAEEIDCLAKLVDAAVYKLDDKIKEQVKTDEKPDGILTSWTFASYQSCYKMERQRLKELVAQDVEVWNQNLESVKVSVQTHLAGL